MPSEQITFQKVDSARQIVYGEVYLPGVPDSDGDFMTAEQIELMAYKFIAKGGMSKVDTGHDMEENGSQVVESFLVRKGDPDFKHPGSWAVGVKVSNDVWPRVESGEINGFSMYGLANIVKGQMIEVEIPDDGVVRGRVTKSEDHEHEFAVLLDSTGKIIGGQTSPGPDGHVHEITKGSVTNSFGGHNHRYNIIDALGATTE